MFEVKTHSLSLIERPMHTNHTWFLLWVLIHIAPVETTFELTAISGTTETMAWLKLSPALMLGMKRYYSSAHCHGRFARLREVALWGGCTREVDWVEVISIGECTFHELEMSTNLFAQHRYFCHNKLFYLLNMTLTGRTDKCISLPPFFSLSLSLPTLSLSLALSLFSLSFSLSLPLSLFLSLSPFLLVQLARQMNEANAREYLTKIMTDTRRAFRVGER